MFEKLDKRNLINSLGENTNARREEITHHIL